MSLARQQATNIGLVVVAVGVVIAVIATAGRATTDEVEARENNVLAAFREDDITSVKLERSSGDIVLERTEVDDGGVSTWYLREPVDEEVDPAAMQDYLDSLRFASWARRINPEEVDRKRFGLDAPRLVIWVRMGEMAFKVRVGKEAASPPGSFYAEVDGENVPKKGVGILSKTLMAELDLTADAFRERLIVPYVSSALDRMTLEGPGGTRKLRATEWEGWRFDGQHGDVRVNRVALDRILLQFARTNADAFLDMKQAEKALAGSETVTIRMVHEKASEPRGLVLVGGQCPTSENEVVGIRREPDPVAACVPRSVMQGLSTPADELIDRNLVYMRKDQIESLSVRQGDRHLDIARKGGGWVMRKPQEAPVDEVAGNQRIVALLRARGDIVQEPDLEKLGLDPPQGELVLTSVSSTEAGVQTETLLLGGEGKNGSRFVLRKHDGFVLELLPEAARSVEPDGSLVRSRKVLDLEPDQIAEIELRSGTTRQRIERHTATTFTLHEPDGFAYDPGLASDLVGRLAKLSADHWVADRDDGSFGLDSPSAVARVIRKGGDGGSGPVDELIVGDSTVGGSYARMKGDSGVFVVPRSVVENLQTLLIDRSGFVVDPLQATRIEIRARGKRVELKKSVERFIQVGGDGEVSPGGVQQIVDALSLMRAEAALHTGGPRPQEGFAEPTLSIRVEREPGRGLESEPIEWRTGSGDAWSGISVFYARRTGIDATFVIARARVQQILDAL